MKRRGFLAMLGIVPAAAVSPSVAVRQHVPCERLLTQAGCYHCAKCGQPILFDPIPFQKTAFKDAIGRCTSQWCEMRDVALRVPLYQMPVDRA